MKLINPIIFSKKAIPAWGVLIAWLIIVTAYIFSLKKNSDLNGLIQFSLNSSQIDFTKVWIILIGGSLIGIIIFLLMLSKIFIEVRSEEVSDMLHEQLSQTNQRLTLALNSAQMGVWDYDPVKNKLHWDKQQFKLFDVLEEEFTGSFESWKNCIHPEDLETAANQSLDALKNGNTFNSEFRIILRNGEIRHIQGLANVIRDENNVATRMIGVNYDISSFKNTQISLQKEKERADIANQAKSQFLATMSHEIRTPLNGIIGLSSIAMQQPMSKELDEYLKLIHQSSSSLLRILNEILDFSKLEVQQLKIQNAPFQLEKIFNEAKGLFTPSAKIKNIFLHLELDSAIENCLIGDEIRIKQVLFNLIGNAIKFTSQGGITIQTKLNGTVDDYVDFSVTVKDTGIGINREDIPKIMRPFEQADSSFSRKYGGTGLGLSISQQLLKLMESSLQIDSELGQGTSMHFHLWLKKANDIEKKTLEIPPMPLPLIRDSRSGNLASIVNLNRKKILVVDDNPTNSTLMLKLIEFANGQSFSCNNGIECLEFLKKNTVDLILMDIQMPIMDGFEATREIRKLDMFKTIPIIGVSAGITLESRETSISSGMNTFIPKPIDLGLFLENIHEWLVINQQDQGFQKISQSM